LRLGTRMRQDLRHAAIFLQNWRCGKFRCPMKLRGSLCPIRPPFWAWPTTHGELLVSTDHNRVHFFDSSMREIRSQRFMTTIYWLKSCSDGEKIAGFTLGQRFSHEHEIYLWSQNGERPRKLGSGSDDAGLWTLADDGSLLLIDLSGGLRWFPEKTKTAPVAIFSVKDKRYVRTLAGDLKRAVFTADGRIVAITENSEIWIWECCGIQSSIHAGH
jgi:hypothetical protein